MHRGIRSFFLLCSNKREERLVDLALPISYLRMLFSICPQERLLFVGVNFSFSQMESLR